MFHEDKHINIGLMSLVSEHYQLKSLCSDLFLSNLHIVRLQSFSPVTFIVFSHS